MKTIRITPVRGTTLAENKEEAAELREQKLLPALAAGHPVAIDFKGIETATQSFVHALIADAIRRYGEVTFKLLVFRNCSEGVQHIIRTVFEYTLLPRETGRASDGGNSVTSKPDSTVINVARRRTISG